MKSLPAIVFLSILILVSGCVQGFDATAVAKSSSTVKAFLSEYPNAKVVASVVSKANIQKDCDNTNLPIKDYWRVTLTDTDTGLTVNAWIDADTKQAVCVVSIGKEKSKTLENNRPEIKPVEPTENKPEKSPEPKPTISPEDELIANLTSNYESYKKLDFSKIDCNRKEHFYVDLLDFSIEETNNNYAKTVEWFPSLSEGNLGSLSVERAKSVGCTKIKPVYGTVVVFDGKIISLKKPSEELIPFGDDLYPGKESYIGSVQIGNNRFEPLKVKSPGEYLVYVYVVNKNTNNMVAIDRIILGVGVPSPAKNRINPITNIPDIGEKKSVFEIPSIPSTTLSPTIQPTSTPLPVSTPRTTQTPQPIASPTSTPTPSPSPTTPSQPPASVVYDDFSSGSLDSSKWTVSTDAAGYTTEYKVDASEGRYHTLQNTARDAVVFLEMTRKINAGERVEFDVNYVSGSGNNIQYVKINGKGIADIMGCSNCGAIGFWNTAGSVGSSTGTYHFKFTFKSNKQVLMETTSGFSQILSVGDNYPYTFRLVSGTGHNGLMHFDYDNFVIYSNVE